MSYTNCPRWGDASSPRALRPRSMQLASKGAAARPPLRGDWGGVSIADIVANEPALLTSKRLPSSYALPGGRKRGLSLKQTARRRTSCGPRTID